MSSTPGASGRGGVAGGHGGADGDGGSVGGGSDGGNDGGDGGGGDGGGEQSTPHVALQNVCQHAEILGCVHRFGYVMPRQAHWLDEEKPGHWKVPSKSEHGAIGGAGTAGGCGESGEGGENGGGGEGQPTLHVRLQYPFQQVARSRLVETQFWG